MNHFHRSGYAPVNGLQLYFEIQGSGRPLLMLHGGFGSTGKLFTTNIATYLLPHMTGRSRSPQ